MPRKEKEVHLFYRVGDDEIQVESDDKKLNQRILDLKKKKPDAVIIINDEDAPAFLRAAVKTEFVTIAVNMKANSVTDAQKKARSENGKKTTHNLKNRKEVKLI